MSTALATTRDKVFTIEQEMHRLADAADRGEIDGLERRVIEVKHHFSHGIYAREVFLPKGTLAAGKLHKYEHMTIISKGDVTIATENGPLRVQAPFTMVSPRGTKRAVYAHEDTVWTTIHGTDETDIKKLEEHFIAESEAEFSAFLEREAQLKEIAACHG